MKFKVYDRAQERWLPVDVVTASDIRATKVLAGTMGNMGKVLCFHTRVFAFITYVITIDIWSSNDGGHQSL